jgi:hypothetical protein
LLARHRQHDAVADRLKRGVEGTDLHHLLGQSCLDSIG